MVNPIVYMDGDQVSSLSSCSSFPSTSCSSYDTDHFFVRHQHLLYLHLHPSGVLSLFIRSPEYSIGLLGQFPGGRLSSFRHIRLK